MTYIEKHEAEAEELLRHAEHMSVDGLHAAQRRLGEEIARRGSGSQWRTLVAPDGWYERLDAGIRFAVRVLHAAGLETCQSCEGGARRAYYGRANERPLFVRGYMSHP